MTNNSHTRAFDVEKEYGGEGDGVLRSLATSSKKIACRQDWLTDTGEDGRRERGTDMQGPGSRI